MSDEQHLQDKPSVLLSSEFLWILSFYSQENFIKLQITGKFLTLSTSISLEKSKPCWSLEGKELSRCKKWNDGWRAAQHQRKIHWPLFEPRLDKASVSQFSEPLVQSSGFKVWKEKSKSSTSLGKLIEKLKHIYLFFHFMAILFEGLWSREWFLIDPIWEVDPVLLPFTLLCAVMLFFDCFHLFSSPSSPTSNLQSPRKKTTNSLTTSINDLICLL